ELDMLTGRAAEGGWLRLNRVIKVVIAGAAGRMGREVVRAICRAEDMELVGAVDVVMAGQDAGTAAGIGEVGIAICTDLAEVLDKTAPDVMVDFTVAKAAEANIKMAISRKVRFVVGTTGMSASTMESIMNEAAQAGVGGAVVPNFALGAVLMMRFAREASRYFPDCEIVELHHDGKVDFPSGTAKATAHEVASGRGDAVSRRGLDGGIRGVEVEGVPIHSVRLPGLVAHQEVIFGGPGQTLTVRHDSLGRDSFMPGVLLAVRKVSQLDHVVLGLDPLLE
ncbi:MAG: 4-hydroxy-tetrahydrodipicolinate reductase, partial [Bacillota bacterium]